MFISGSHYDINNSIPKSCEDTASRQKNGLSPFFETYPPDLEHVINFLTADPETITLLEAIEREGIDPHKKISIAFSSELGRKPVRYYYLENKILLNETLRCASLEEILPHLFFELQNAKQQHKFREAMENRAQCSKGKRVERIEQFEYHSAMATHFYVQNLIRKHEFSNKTHFAHVFLNFKDHYLFQQLTGHSQQIAEHFDDFYPKASPSTYRGTWKHPPPPLQVPILLALLINKAIAETGTAEEKLDAEKRIQSSLSKIKKIISDHKDSLAAHHLLENALQVIPES